MQNIDLKSWPRASQYAFFRNYANPHFSVTASVDVTRLMEIRKVQGVSVFNACLFAITGAGNDIPEFRTRFRGDHVFICEEVNASVTVPLKDGKFAFCDIGWSAEWETFDEDCKREIASARKQQTLANHVADQPEWLYLTCLPWTRFSSMTHPVAGPDDCIPRIAWGQIHRFDGKWQMPVTAQLHHALADGVHLGIFFERLQDRLDNI